MQLSINKDIVTFFIDDKNARSRMEEILTPKKLDLLFINIESVSNGTKLTFYELFALETYYLFFTMTAHTDDPFFPMEAYMTATMSLSNGTWIKNILGNNETYDKLDLSMIKKDISFTVMKHQLPAFNKYMKIKSNLDYRGLTIDAAPGAGKTLMASALMVLLEVDVCVITCPLTLVNTVWVTELTKTGPKKMFNVPQSVYVVNQKSEYKGEKFIICHFENLKNLPAIMRGFDEKKVGLIVDESHKVGNNKSNRTNELLKIVDEFNPDELILLSGTPIMTNKSEIITIMDYLDKRFVGDARERFIELYKGNLGMLQNTLRVRYKGSSVLIEAATFKKPAMHVRVDVSLANPKPFLLNTIREKSKEFIKYKLELYGGKNLKKYQDRFYAILSEYEEKNKNIDKKKYKIYRLQLAEVIKAYESGHLGSVHTEINEVSTYEKKHIRPTLDSSTRKEFDFISPIVKYVALKIQGENLSRVIGGARKDCHTAMAKELDFKPIINSSIKKVLVFSKHIETCDAAMINLANSGIKAIGLYGEEGTVDGNLGASNIDKGVKMFADDPNIEVIVSNYATLSTGVPLIEATTIVAIDLPYKDGELTQTIARINRIGQDSDCKFIYLELDTGVDYNINQRNLDINELNRQTVSMLTGKNLDKIITTKIEDSNIVNELNNIVFNRYIDSVKVDIIKYNNGIYKKYSKAVRQLMNAGKSFKIW